MSFLLKIVEGPNKGAEIALVEGVAVTIGKGDACDVVLADATLPDAPVSVAASASGVTVDGSAFEPLHVMTLGSTSFAVGPADAPWGALVWPKSEAGKPEVSAAPEAKREEEPAPGGAPGPASEEPPREERRKRGGCLGCLVALAVLLLVLAGLGVWLRGREAQDADSEGFVSSLFSRISFFMPGTSGAPAAPVLSRTPDLSGVAEKYGLSLVDVDGVQSLSGNLKTRRERRSATAEAYEAQPGVELDLSDDESFRSAAEDALFTLTEGALKVSAATNRVLSIVGETPSPRALKRTLDALNADMPKLRGVDVAGVVLSPGAAAPADDGDDEFSVAPRASRA
ncbi:MAG: hypothetical protein J6U17_00425, partial [Kiritimatiellae bacterium]|nr:hypothetical protein [Kiritimatiellia bacterium]